MLYKLPDLEITNNFSIEYHISETNFNFDSSTCTDITVIVKSMYLNRSHKLLFGLSTIRHNNSKVMIDYYKNKISHQLYQIRNNIVDLLNSNIDDLPMHINDEEPYMSLTLWLLDLPRTDCRILVKNYLYKL
jgi:hypothetical protein